MPPFMLTDPDSDSYLSSSNRIGTSDVGKDGIAIIGFAANLPSASSTESFWRMTVDGRCAARDFPPERMNHEAWHDATGSIKGSLRPKKAHFLETDVASFDAPFFSITADEAAAMDPQQRGLLEIAYRALENAGIPLGQISGTNAAVFTGNFTADYMMLNAKDPELVPRYASTGLAGAFLSNRLSTFFNLTGPSMTIDTACSSSLVAFDQACKALWNGEASLGIVTGCNLIFALDTTLGLSQMGFLSSDGICYSFDERASGYSRGEGFTAVILKPVSQAIRDGDTIRAVVRATGSNQNGSTNLASPSKEAQIRLIEETYHRAGLDLSRTRYVEAHGTGTAAGDPIEADAIGETFGRHQSRGAPVYIGSAKANIGHTEGASGLAGIIKTVMVLEKGIIPPIANLRKLNPSIDASFLNLEFPKGCLPWPGVGLRRASVCSSGFGGSNAHAVIEDACHHLQERGLRANHCTVPCPDTGSEEPVAVEDENVTVSRGEDLCLATPRLFVWSAADSSALKRLLTSYEDHISDIINLPNPPADYFESLAHTLGERRSLLPWRSYAVAESLPSLIGAISSAPAPVKSQSQPKIGFVFTGQGAQWLGMGRELLVYPVFRNSVEHADTYLRGLGCTWSLLDDVFTTKSNNTNSNIQDPALAQPSCTVLQVALVDLLRSFNTFPAVALGHSSGEIAAAYAVNAISREAAWRLAYFRGTLCSRLERCNKTSGGMISVGISYDLAISYIDKVREQPPSGLLCVACNNSPSNVTISGDRILLDRLKGILDADKIFNRILAIPVAYHSPQVQSIAAAYAQSIGQIEPGSIAYEAVPMVSSVSGRIVSSDTLLDPKYWVANLVSPVEFTRAVEYCCRDLPTTTTKKLDLSHRLSVSVTDLLEVGPHSTLQGPIRETLNTIFRAQKIRYTSCLLRHQSAISTMMNVAGKLHSLQCAVNISRVNATTDSHKATRLALPSLPGYPFDHSTSYWIESRISKSIRLRSHGYRPFLGAPVADWDQSEPRWRHFLSSSTSSNAPWIRDHKINGDILYPAAGMLVMALEATIQILTDTNENFAAFEYKDVEFPAGLKVPDDEQGVEVGISLTNLDNSPSWLYSGFEFRIDAHRDGGITKVCRGMIRPIIAQSAPAPLDHVQESDAVAVVAATEAEKALRRFTKEIEGSKLYTRLYKLGYHFGNSFRRIEHVHWEKIGEAIGKVSIYDDPLAVPTIIHPATLDGVIQVMLPAATSAGNARTSIMIPTRISRLWIAKDGLLPTSSSQLQTHTTMRSTTFRSKEFNSSTFDMRDNSLRIEFEGIQATSIANLDETDSAQEHTRQLCFEMINKPDLSLLSTDRLREMLEAQKSKDADPRSLWDDIQALVWELMRRVANEFAEHDVPCHLPHLRKHLKWIQQSVLHNTRSPITAPDLYEKVNRHGRIGQIYTSFVDRFPEILQGKADALEYLSQDNILTDYYDFNNRTSKFWQPLSYFMESLAHKNPALRIMEVGAGTGSTTKHLMSSLARETSYGSSTLFSRFDFTDVSQAFLNAAKNHFIVYPKMHFQIFDVEKEANEQGFEEHSYDVVIAANVLHATKSLDTTVRALRTLLKRDGILILIEITEPAKVVAPIIFGCLPGWWLSEDDYRPNGPCVSEEQWDCLLKRHGFSGVDIALHDYDTEIHFVSCMISTAKEENAATIGYPDLPITIISGFSEQDSTQTPLCQVIQRLPECTQRKISTFADVACDDFLHEQLVIVVCQSSWPVLDRLSDEEYHRLQTTLTKALAVLWINEGTNQPNQRFQGAMVTGLARALRLERTGFVFTTVNLESSHKNTSLLISQALHNTIKGIRTGVYEPELIQNSDVLEIPRTYEDDSYNQAVHAATRFVQQDIAFGSKDLDLKIRSPGLLASLYFEERSHTSAQIEADEVEIEVKAIGINFRDLLLALGSIDDDTFGSECSGIVSRVGHDCTLRPGDRVVVGHSDPFCRSVRCKEFMALPIPDEMTYNEAAAIPINFMTAYRALIEIAHLSKGETVLIHAGAGGTGQAAIQISQYCGAKIFVTVGSDSKKQRIMELYNIPADQILYSRDTSFAQGVKRLTNGQGVDVVLNSTAGPSLLASWECVAPYGRFIEIGKKDILSRRSLPMVQFSRNVSFSAVDIASMSKERPRMLSRMLSRILELFKQGLLQDVSPLKAFSISQCEEALRYLQSGTNAGKAVIEIDRGAQVSAFVKSSSSWSFDSDGTYVVSGGLGGLGRSVVRWMVGKGARHFLLLSRSGGASSIATTFLRELASLGIDVQAPPCDISDPAALQRALDSCNDAMPPIKGCIQSSMVIRDVSFERMTPQQWREAVLPKVSGSWNLHHQLPRNLDFFILFSSTTGIVGSQSQSNYAAGNAFQDALAHFRRSRGEPATSIDICVMESIGILADHRDVADQIINIKHIMPMSEEELLALLDEHCRPAVSTPASARPRSAQIVTGLTLPARIAANGGQEPAWMSQPMFRPLYQIPDRSASTGTVGLTQAVDGDPSSVPDLTALLSDPDSTVQDVAAALTAVLSDKITKFLSLDLSDLDASKPLRGYGVDSLIGMELRSWLTKALKVEVSVFEILGEGSIESMAILIANKIADAEVKRQGKKV